MNEVISERAGEEEGQRHPRFGAAAFDRVGEGLNLRDLSLLLWHGKWIILAVTMAVLALALIYAFRATPIYEADAMVQIQQQSQAPAGGGQSGDVLSLLFPTAAPTQTEIQIMGSRSVLRPVVEQEHLNIRVNDEGFLASDKRSKAVEISALAVPDAWMGQTLQLVADGAGRYTLESPDGQSLLQGTAGDPATARDGALKITVSKLALPTGTHVSVARIFDQKAVSELQRRLTIVELGLNTGIVQLSLQGADPALTRDVLNAVANSYMKQNVAAMAAQAQQALDFVNKQLPQLKHQLDVAGNALTAYQSKHGVVNLDQQAAGLLTQLTTLQGQLMQLQLTQSAMQQRFTSSYPGFQGLQSQRQDLKNQIAAVQAQIGNLPAKERDYLTLLQSVQVNQQLYTALLARAQDLQVTAASTVGSARIVDYAVTPLAPVKPKKALIGLIGLILGLLLGIAGVFLRRALHRGIEDSAEIERAFGLPVYAVVPHSTRQHYFVRRAGKSALDPIRLLAAQDPQDPAIESIRSLRTSLAFVLQRAPGNLVAIGGCTPGVGKSFLSANLAHVLAASGTRVLLVDADLRRGYLERYFGVPKQPGFSQFLSGDAGLEEIISHGALHKNLDFITSGPFPTNPYDLLFTSHVKDYFCKLSTAYDAILFDIPPLLTVADGILLGQIADVNLLVLKAGEATLPETRIALDRMQQNGIRLDGFVFNDLTREAATYTFGRAAKTYYYARYEPEAKAPK